MATTRETILVDVEVEGQQKLSDLGNKLENTGKQGKKASAGLDDAATAFRAMGPAGTLAGDSLERLSIIMSSPLGAAIAGSVAGLAVLGLAMKGASVAISKYIESSEEMVAAQKRVTTSTDEFSAAVGKILVGDDFDRAMRGMSLMIDDLTAKLEAASSSSGMMATAITVVKLKAMEASPL